MALGAVAFGLKGRSFRIVTVATGGLRCFSRFVHAGFEVQRSSFRLLEECVVTDFAIAFHGFKVGGVNKGDITGLRFEDDLLRRLLVLSQQGEASNQQ